MALRKCPNCGKKYSEHAEKCPKCGLSFNEATEKHNVERSNKKKKIKKLIPLFVVLALIGLGVGGFFLQKSFYNHLTVKDGQIVTRLGIVVSKEYEDATKLSFRPELENINEWWGYIVKGKNQKWGTINRELKTVIPLEYDELDELSIYSRRFFRARKNGMWGIIDGIHDNHEVVPCKYDSINVISSRLFLTQSNGKYGCYSDSGEHLADEQYDNWRELNDSVIVLISRVENSVCLTKSGNFKSGMFIPDYCAKQEDFYGHWKAESSDEYLKEIIITPSFTTIISEIGTCTYPSSGYYMDGGGGFYVADEEGYPMFEGNINEEHDKIRFFNSDYSYIKVK